jgi:hypothetical protein
MISPARILAPILASLALTGFVGPVVARQNQEEDTMGKIIEEKISLWKRTKDNNAFPSESQRCTVSDVSGVWKRGGGMDYTTIKLFPMKSGRYRLLFSTGGCLSHWSLELTATYRDGVLLLNRPVEEYIPAVYDRLFTIKTPQGIRLISDTSLAWSRSQHETTPHSLWMFIHKASPHPVVPKTVPARPLAQPL